MAMSHIIEPRNSAVCCAHSRKANDFSGLQFVKLGFPAAGLKKSLLKLPSGRRATGSGV
jgi:hypothetical protein